MHRLIRCFLLSGVLLAFGGTQAQERRFESFDIGPGPGCSVMLAWRFISPDNLFLSVERSNDRIYWEKVDSCMAQSGTNNFVLDPSPTNGVSYYRLVATEAGSAIYSQTKAIQINTSTDVFIWKGKNPAYVYLKTLSLAGEVFVRDALNKVVSRAAVIDFLATIPAGSIKNGSFVFEIVSEKRKLRQRCNFLSGDVVHTAE
ncbi:MAG: hypothetical protein EOO05_02300 [Chitinophagaceae bacterium]|nr:MAG: hypothetical protein EOO05_02300 [Chitinophagaceae bacterium]